MARPKSVAPTYKHHKSTGLARCWVGGKWVSLGRFGSPESRQEHARICAELASGPGASISAPRARMTLDELLLAFFRYAAGHYRGADGKPTSQLGEFKYAVRPMRELYGHTPAADFGPLALKAVRAKMVAAGWCRRQVNDRVGKLKRVFKWAVSEQLVPVAVHQALATVAGLQCGRTEAPESAPVLPVDPAIVDATVARLNREAAGLIRFAQLTGCRPGEACIVRRCDIDASGRVWLYTPATHKTAWKGKSRVIAIGPRAQEAIRAYLDVEPTAYLFDPRRVRGPQRADSRRRPREHYSTHSIAHAVRQAARAAGVPTWSPLQLRHTFATTVRKGHGLEAAQVLLGTPAPM